MPRQTSYLQRRGDMLFFRLSVPSDLRPFVGGCEITKTLRTTDKRVAVPLALEYAACVIRMFSDLRASMVAPDGNKILEIVRKAKEKLRLDMVKEEHEGELDDLQAQHRLDRKLVKLETENEVLKRFVPGFLATGVLTPAQLQADAPAARKTLPTPMFKTVVDDFLNSYQRNKKQAMFRKHQPVLKMLLDVVGDKSVPGAQSQLIAEWLSQTTRSIRI